jgi:hypothetical protein
MDGPLQIIAKTLPLGPDEWVSDRAECAAGILEALDKAGWVIVPDSMMHPAAIHLARLSYYPQIKEGRVMIPHGHPLQEAYQPNQCHGHEDGECFWEHCPQLRDGEPRKSGRHCPLDHDLDE